MIKRIDFLLNLICFIIISIIITGGVNIRNSFIKLDLTSVDVWGITFLILGSILYYKYKKIPECLFFINQKIKNCEIKHLVFSLIFMTFIVFLAHLVKHVDFRTHGWDMAYVHQALFYPFGEKLLNCNVCGANTYFAEHMAWSFFVPAVITQFIKSDLLVFFMQSFFLFLGIYASLFSRENIKSKDYVIYLMFLFFISSRSFRNAGVWDFREDVIGFLGLCIFLLSFRIKNYFTFFVGFFIAISSKEQVAFLMLFTCIPLFFEKNIFNQSFSKKIIIPTILFFSFLWIYYVYAVAFPGFAKGVEAGNPLVLRFSQYGKSTTEIIKNIAFYPRTWWELLKGVGFDFKVIKYLVILLLPFTYYLKKRPLWIIPVLPSLLFNLMVGSAQVSMNFHYDLLILPFLFFLVMHVYEKELNLRPLLISTVFAVCLSGRWPLSKVHLIGLDRVHQYQFLKDLSYSEVVGGSIKTLAHISHLKSIREIQFEINDKPSSIKDFYSSTLKNSRNKGQLDAVDLEYFILDRENDLQKNLSIFFDEFIVKRDITNRFVLISLKDHKGE